MVCLLERRLFHERQDVSFDITSAHHRGRNPLLRARASELAIDAEPYVCLEQLPGPDGEPGEPLAWFSTDELWDGDRPEEVRGKVTSLPLFRASGEPFGRICFFSTPERGDLYQVFSDRSEHPLLTFSGEFAEHSVQVVEGDALGKLAAQCDPSRHEGDEDVSQVKIEPGVDAGVVLLGLMAIDKMQRRRTGDAMMSMLNTLRTHLAGPLATAEDPAALGTVAALATLDD